MEQLPEVFDGGGGGRVTALVFYGALELVEVEGLGAADYSLQLFRGEHLDDVACDDLIETAFEG